MPSPRTLFRVLNPIPHIRASSLSSEQRKEEVHSQVWGSRACSQDGDAAESVGKVRWWWSPKDNLGHSYSFVWSQSALGSHQDSDRMKTLPSISLQSVLSVSCVWGNVWNTVLALGAGSTNLQQVPWARSEGLRRWGVCALYPSISSRHLYLSCHFGLHMECHSEVQVSGCQVTSCCSTLEDGGYQRKWVTGMMSHFRSGLYFLSRYEDEESQLLAPPCLPPTMPPTTLWVASPQTMAKISPFLPKCFPSKEKEPNAVITQDSNVGIRITAGWKMQFLVHVRRK